MANKSKIKCLYKLPKNYLITDHRLFDHPQYQSLSHAAIHLLFDMCRLYNGFNNGDISIAQSDMKLRGWCAGTLDKAKNELLVNDWIRLVRRGSKFGLCHLYALSWIPLNDNQKLDINSKDFVLRDLSNKTVRMVDI